MLFLVCPAHTLLLKSKNSFGVLVSRKLFSRECSQVRAAGYSYDEHEEFEALNVFNERANPRDKRDALPYWVEVSPTKRKLGIFSLNRHTRSGDIIAHELAFYQVCRVRCLYRFKDGKFEMFQKLAEVVQTESPVSNN